MRAKYLSNSIAHNGTWYAKMHSGSLLTPVARVKEVLQGITQVTFMKDISESPQLDHVIAKLTLIGQQVFRKENMHIWLNASPESMTSALKHTNDFADSLPDSRSSQAFKKPKITYRTDRTFVTQDKVQMQFELPFQVSFITRSCKMVPFDHPHFMRFAKIFVLVLVMCFNDDIFYVFQSRGFGCSDVR